jgi:AcrR family transcriptional regulator
MPRTAPADSEAADEAGPASTRDRILDASLDLFVEHGFDGTSVRQIAERVGTTKAALYYYFASKDEILMALHMRLHEFGQERIETMGDEPMTLEAWGALLRDLMGEITAQRMLFLLHQRNQAAFEKLHSTREHDDAHEDIQGRFRAILADPRVPLRDRVRMAGAVGVLFAGTFLYGEAFSSASSAELRDILAGIVEDVLRAP